MVSGPSSVVPGRVGAVPSTRAEEAGGSLVEVEYPVGPVDDDQGVRLVVGLQEGEGVGDRRREGVVGLVVDGLVAGRAQHGVDLPQRHAERGRQEQDHLRARHRPPCLQEAHVAGRHVGVQGQVELAQAALAAPVLEEGGEQPAAVVRIGHRAERSGGRSGLPGTYLVSSLRRRRRTPTIAPMPTLTASDAADLFRHDPDRFLDVGEGEVAYRRVGTGPDVLFVHGWPVSGATFRTLLPHLVDHVTCHVIDLPGTGSSRFDAGTRLTIDQHIESVRRSIDRLGARRRRRGRPRQRRHDRPSRRRRRPPPPGHGPDRHRAEPRAELALQAVPRRSEAARLRRRPRLGRRAAAAAPEPVRPRRRLRRPGLLDGEFDEFFLAPLHDRPERLDAGHPRCCAASTTSMVTDLGAIHRRIDVPVRLVWGDQDPFFPLAWAEEMVGTFPDADLEVVRGAALFAHEERPAEVAAALLPVLTGTR